MLPQARSLHLLPPLRRCLGLPSQYLGHRLAVCTGGTDNGAHWAPRDPRVVAAWLSALSQGQLGKAMQAGSVAADLALECLGSALFGGSSSSMQDQSLAENAEAADDSGEAAGHTEGMLSAVRETRAASGRKARVPPGGGSGGFSGGGAAARERLAVSVVQQLDHGALTALIKVR